LRGASATPRPIIVVENAFYLRAGGALPGLQSAAAAAESERVSASPLSPLVVLRSLARSFIP